MQAAGGVHDQHIRAGVDSFAPRFLSQTLDRGRVGFADFAFVDVGLDRLGHDFKLLAGRRTIHVNRNQQRPMPPVLQPVRQLAGRSGFTRTLQAGHKHNGRRLRCELDLRSIAAQDLDQFIAKNLDDLLGRRERGRHLLPNRLLLDMIDELFYDLEVDISLEQRQADGTQRLLHVFFVEGGFAAQGLKRALQFF